MTIEQILSNSVKNALKTLYGIETTSINFEKTNPDFEGDLTLVIFPYLKISKKKPEETANEIGTFLKQNTKEITSFNVIKGFLNIVIDNSYWLNYFKSICNQSFISSVSVSNSQSIVVEYSSPNTNKPLHLGHVRNILLGYSVANILKAAGNNVKKVNLVNDRGIHICKSMLAWQKWGNSETPENSKIKGDHLVGKYYVIFDKHYKEEIKKLKEEGYSDEDAEKQAPIMKEAQEMLRKWETGDEQVKSLWKMMNQWVYNGFDVTYKKLGADFDKTYYESNTYLLGKTLIEEGLSTCFCNKRTDNSIYIDLTPDGLDEKTLLRGDGTSVYMTQDLGTAVQRAEELKFDKHIYTVGNEQDYHFKVLFLILKKLGYKWAEGLYHLSYGMVELPEGKMKSREGTVVDADDLMQEMIDTAAATTKELGKADGLTEEEANELYETIGMGALKYFILKVDPKKKMLFNPAESIDFNGHTSPFIQFNYVRIKALLRKANDLDIIKIDNVVNTDITISAKEKELIILLNSFTPTLLQSAKEYSPALIANYVYDLAKEYSQYYHDTPILKEENKDILIFRLQLSKTIGIAIKEAMNLLGIRMPERM